MKKPEKKSYYYRIGKGNYVVYHWNENMKMYFESGYHSYAVARHAVACTNRGEEY
jgi:hypothetical protein